MSEMFRIQRAYKRGPHDSDPPSAGLLDEGKGDVSKRGKGDGSD